MKKMDWTPTSKKYLENRKIVLHTDRAKSYQARVKGMVHDSARHCKKRVKINGKWIWRNPVYSKVVTHKLPDGTKLKVKTGTQVIDRAWRFFRRHLEGLALQPGSNRLAAAVRPGQWLYWNRDKDLWSETGTMLKALNYR